MDRSALKQQAKMRLQGNWGWAVGLMLLGSIMAALVGWLTFGILEAMVSVGLSIAILHFVDDGDRGRGIFDNIFSGFTGRRPMAVFLNLLLTMIFIWLWTLLLVIPGIIKSFAYSQVPYILADMQSTGQEIGATEAIAASQELMRGHKWEYFVLQLSFLGWAILCVLTCGIGYLWLAPYQEATNAAYYRALAGDQFRAG